MLSYFHRFSNFVWTVENDSNTLRRTCGRVYFRKRRKKSSFSKISGYVLNIWSGLVLDQNWGIGEPQMVQNPVGWPCLGQKKKSLNTPTLFRTKDKMNAVFFLSNLLAIAMEKIPFIVIAFVYLGYTRNCKNVVIGKWKKEKAKTKVASTEA